MSADFQFDTETHSYYLDGVKLPSVTQVLNSTGVASYQDVPAMEYYLDRGTAIHKACELLSRGNLDEDSLDDRIKPYVEAFRKFLSDTDAVIEQTEVRTYHPAHRYAGTVDAVAVLNGRRCLLDYKTTVVTAWTGIQLAAYAEMLGGITEFRRFGLALTKDKTYKLVPFRDMTDRSVWYAALTVHKWKANNNSGSKQQ